MAVWDELKAVLLDLEPQGVLTACPDPRMDEDREPPFGIDLAPWATDAAESLHERFGDDVELVVGEFTYPGCLPSPSWVAPPHEDIPEIDAAEMTVDLEAPMLVCSGHTVQGALRVHNMNANTIVILTNGQVTAHVVDPRTGAVVGGFFGSQKLPLVEFQAAPDNTVVVPVLVGTASLLPDLGYAVPAGEWAIQVVFKLADDSGGGWQRERPGRRRVRTPLLPITVTD